MSHVKSLNRVITYNIFDVNSSQSMLLSQTMWHINNLPRPVIEAVLTDVYTHKIFEETSSRKLFNDIKFAAVWMRQMLTFQYIIINNDSEAATFLSLLLSPCCYLIITIVKKNSYVKVEKAYFSISIYLESLLLLDCSRHWIKLDMSLTHWIIKKRRKKSRLRCHFSTFLYSYQLFSISCFFL